MAMTADDNDRSYTGPLDKTKLSQNRRASFHDYCEPAIYMFTVKKNPDIPPFSRIVGNPRMLSGSEVPRVVCSEIGQILSEEILKTQKMRPTQIRIRQFMIMPDHVHLMLEVLTRLNYPVTKIVAQILSATTLNCRRCGLISPSASAFDLEGINDRILYGAGQLDILYNYIADNPRRYLIKKLHPDLFRRRSGIRFGNNNESDNDNKSAPVNQSNIDNDVDKEPGGEKNPIIRMDCVGNIFLLRQSLKQVHVRSFWSDDLVLRFEEECRLHVSAGGVLISPFISPKERKIMYEAIERGGKVIRITDRGFGERWKPSGREFELCAEGRLLVMAESGSSTRREEMHYRKASHLNRVAALIVETAAAKKFYLTKS